MQVAEPGHTGVLRGCPLLTQGKFCSRAGQRSAASLLKIRPPAWPGTGPGTGDELQRSVRGHSLASAVGARSLQPYPRHHRARGLWLTLFIKEKENESRKEILQSRGSALI